MNKETKAAIIRALRSTLETIHGDVQEARAQMGETGFVPQSEVIEMVIDQTIDGFTYGGNISKEDEAVWVAMANDFKSQDAEDLAKEAFPYKKY